MRVCRFANELLTAGPGIMRNRAATGGGEVAGNAVNQRDLPLPTVCCRVEGGRSSPPPALEQVFDRRYGGPGRPLAVTVVDVSMGVAGG